MLSPEVLRAIGAWRGSGVSPEAAAFARRVVTAAAPPRPARAKTLLWGAARLGEFALSIGVVLDEERCLHPSVIERCIETATRDLSPAGRQTLRAALRFVSSRVLPGRAPAPMARVRAKPPYTDAEVAAWLARADAQPHRARRLRASALVCLGAGAGLIGRELRDVRGSDVAAASGGLVVAVTGSRRRVVPVRPRFHRRVVEAASFAGERYVIGGERRDRHNVTNQLVSSISERDDDLGRLDLGRLRSTWLVAAMEVAGLPALLEVAGIACPQRLGDLVAFCSPVGEDEAVARFG